MPYAPDAVTIFEGIRCYLGKNGMVVDYVLDSNDDALVEALTSGQVDIAWNTPLAFARVFTAPPASMPTWRGASPI